MDKIFLVHLFLGLFIQKGLLMGVKGSREERGKTDRTISEIKTAYRQAVRAAGDLDKLTSRVQTVKT
ncbi:hypothetical protein QE152_g15442 [Popillia japonica]|uniref:Uncharacterized protein n=1 Tax=Popillia japonica TaxID=7064 RepID=A0AAW1L836_POPJA